MDIIATILNQQLSDLTFSQLQFNPNKSHCSADALCQSFERSYALETRSLHVSWKEYQEHELTSEPES
jgi:hypothetical protein